MKAKAPARRTAGTADNDPRSRRSRGTLVVLCAAVFLNALDSSIVAIALPTIQRSLGLGTSALQWVVSGFALGYGGFLLLGGRVADAAGRRRVLLTAVGAFAAASLLAGLAGSGGLLLVARVAAGTSLAFVVPASLSLIAETYPEEAERGHALGIYSAVGASGWTAGLLLGGILATASWRLVFLLQAPVAAAILAASPRVMPPDRRPADRTGQPDVAGAVLGTAALLAIVYGLSQVASQPLGSIGSLLRFGMAGVLTISVVVAERKAADPLLPAALLRSRNGSTANIVGFAFFGSYSGYLFICTLYLQQVLGWSALHTAFAFLPAALIAAAASPSAGALIKRRGLASVLFAGMVTMALSYALLLRITGTSSYPAVVLPTVVLVGVGAAITFPSVNVAVLAGVEERRRGVAGGLLNASMQVGAGVVLAAVTAAIAARSGLPAGVPRDPAAVLAGYRLGLAVTAGVAALGAVAVLARPPRAGQAQPAAVSVVTPGPDRGWARRSPRPTRAARTRHRPPPASGR